MNRRDSIKTLFAGIAGLFAAPSAAAAQPAPKPFWREEPFEMGGIKGTTFHWPCDRPIFFNYRRHFEPEAGISRIECIQLWPNDRCCLPLEGEIQRQLYWQRASARAAQQAHAHLVYIDGRPDLYALHFDSVKLSPVVDYFAKE